MTKKELIELIEPFGNEDEVVVENGDAQTFDLFVLDTERMNREGRIIIQIDKDVKLTPEEQRLVDIAREANKLKRMLEEIIGNTGMKISPDGLATKKKKGRPKKQ